ncbi:MAG: hypothetical protein AB7U83_04055, partial [Vicinamibacterales bacterium]
TASRRGVGDQAVRDRVSRACTAWSEVCRDDPSEPLPKPELTRATVHYRDALELAYLLIDGLGASDLLMPGVVAGRSFLLNMPRLFEELVGHLVREIGSANSLDVAAQHREESVLWDPDLNRRFGSVRPDLLVESRDRQIRIPIDAKYKDYGHQKLKQGDLYQGALYAATLARPPKGRLPTCLMFYPAQDATARPQRVQVRVNGVGTAEVVVMGLPMEDLLHRLPHPNLESTMASAPWQAELMELVAT